MMAGTKRTRAQVEEAIRQSGGIAKLIATKLRISRSTYYSYLRKWTDLREVINEAEEELGDAAELKLLQLIEAGDGPSIRFYLETRHKHRGYTRRVENVGKDGGPIEMTASERSDALRDITTKDLKALVEAARNAQEPKEAHRKETSNDE